MTTRTIHVTLAAAAYDVTIESGMLTRLGGITTAVAPDTTAVLVVDDSIDATYGETARVSLREAGYATTTVAMRADESHKTLATVQGMYEAMLDGEGTLARGTPVVALGGGIVGDTAGFAAATLLRGLPLVQVPTTLLAMVDAAIGGKTGVNFELPGGGLGKNMIGAFWQPRAVVMDPRLLSTLEPRDFRCGLAECVKYGMIADDGLLGFLEEHGPAITARDLDVLATLIERCVRIKAGIVQEDERESGRRALLNLGHTFAHAIEARQELGLRHGEAVSIGLIAAATCAVRTDRLPESAARRIASLLEAFGLPLRLPAAVDVRALWHAMRYDKKAVHGRVRLIVPNGPGSAEITDDVPQEIIDAAWSEVGAADG